MKIYPNASMLSLITQTENGKGKILFLYIKSIPDVYPSNNVYWYDGAGKDGTARYIWENLSIRQWVGCGKDEKIAEVLDILLKKNIIEISGKTIEFIIPTIYEVQKSNSYSTKTNFITENNNLIPPDFYEKENLKFLSGYKLGSDEITPTYPLGFYDEDFISRNLEDNIWGVVEARTSYLTFHGVREKSRSGIGSSEMVGFYQHSFIANDDYIVRVLNKEELEIGSAPINKETGFFKIFLNEPTIKGKVEILHIDEIEKSSSYVLIQDIQTNINIANTSFIDAYGRDFMLTSDNKERPIEIKSNTWQQKMFADLKVANQGLSDLFKANFDYLGPRILIADPYFIGDIKTDELTGILSPSECQTAFINSLFHSALEKGVTQLTIMGYWARAKKHMKNDWIAKYEQFFKTLIKSNKLEKYFPTGSIRFLNVQEDFHSRYWFSINEIETRQVFEKCIIMTNSLGNMKELDIVCVRDAGQMKQVSRKYSMLYGSAEEKLCL